MGEENQNSKHSGGIELAEKQPMNTQERLLKRFTRVIARNVLSSTELARLRDEKLGTLTTFEKDVYKIVDIWRDDLNCAIACCELARGE